MATTAAMAIGYGCANAVIIGFSAMNGLMKGETRQKWMIGYTWAITT